VKDNSVLWVVVMMVELDEKKVEGEERSEEAERKWRGS
jgi:hypothetical protein